MQYCSIINNWITRYYNTRLVIKKVVRCKVMVVTLAIFNRGGCADSMALKQKVATMTTLLLVA